MMSKYILRRLFSGILTILMVFVLDFIIIKAAPGDPVRTIMGKETDDPELRAALMEKYGLDKPLHVQFVSQLKNMLRGDFGNSIIYNRSVADMIKERLPATLLLGLVDCILALIIGTALGIFCAAGMARSLTTSFLPSPIPWMPCPPFGWVSCLSSCSPPA